MEMAPIELVTAPTALAVPLVRAKRHCRVEIEEDNEYITDLIRSATGFCEDWIYGRRTVVQTTYDLRLDSWFDCLELPAPPLSSVTSLKYYDADNTLQTWSAANYTVYTPLRARGRIEVSQLATIPTVYAYANWPIVIRFVAGYATASIPYQVKQAILMLVEHWYANRGPVVIGTISSSLELSVKNLLENAGWGSYR